MRLDHRNLVSVKRVAHLGLRPDPVGHYPDITPGKAQLLEPLLVRDVRLVSIPHDVHSWVRPLLEQSAIVGHAGDASQLPVGQHLDVPPLKAQRCKLVLAGDVEFRPTIDDVDLRP
jgi:hypothetical protein